MRGDNMEKKDDIVLKVDHLKKYFPVKNGLLGKNVDYVHAVDDVSFEMIRGTVVGLVGESGCGKSTLAQTVMGIYKPTEGFIEISGIDTGKSFSKNKEMKKLIQIVFQDPFWSLNPRMMVKDIIAEPINVHRLAKGDAVNERVGELLEMVGIDKQRMYSYPHEFSGGERQRVAIARSLAMNPQILLLDEPTSSIDTISQVEILNLLVDIKKRFNLSYILISHDLSVIYYLSNQIVVMYLGEVVEIGNTEDVFNKRYHPYTQALMRAIPVIAADGTVERIDALEGNVPSAINPPKGCRFHDRCEFCQERCRTENPALREIEPGHKVACHFAHLPEN